MSLACWAWIWRISVRSICLTGICMSLVTSPLSAVVTGTAGGVTMYWPGTAEHAASMAASTRDRATRVPGTPWLFLFGRWMPDCFLLFIMVVPFTSVSVGVAHAFK